MSKLVAEKWVVIDSGGRVMLKAVGEPQIICTLETVPLKISPQIQDRAYLIAAAPELLTACKAAVYILKRNVEWANELRGQPWYAKAQAAIAKATKE